MSSDDDAASPLKLGGGMAKGLLERRRRKSLPDRATSSVAVRGDGGGENHVHRRARLPSRLLIRRLPRTEAAGRAAKGVVPRTALRPPPPLEAVMQELPPLVPYVFTPQYKGGSAEGGRKPSIWNTFAHQHPAERDVLRLCTLSLPVSSTLKNSLSLSPIISSLSFPPVFVDAAILKLHFDVDNLKTVEQIAKTRAAHLLKYPDAKILWIGDPT